MASGWLLLMHIFLLPSTQGLPGYRGPPGEKGDLGDPGPEGRSVSTSLYVPSAPQTPLTPHCPTPTLTAGYPKSHWTHTPQLSHSLPL